MNGKDFQEVLNRYLSGQATEEEVAWIESAYINWNQNDIQPRDEQKLEDATKLIWKVVNAKTRPFNNITRLFPILYAAAVLVICSIIGIVIYKQLSSSAGTAESYLAANIQPGKSRAILVLSDGRKIDLDKASKGHFADQTGVEISKTTDGQIVYKIPEQEIRNNKTEYNTIETPSGGQYQVELPDGTKVWMNASSSLTFAASFSGERTVKLKGEAYFEVSKLSEGGTRIPFIVKTENQKISVLGTHFNVNTYDDEPFAKTTLLEGSIKVNDTHILKPGQQANIKEGNINVLNVNAEDFIDWKNGDFILENNDFRSIMRKIARWYDVQVFYAEDAPKNINLGGWISRSKNISSILKLMEETGKVHFKIEGRRITVTK
ncbi:hypothetical protein ASU31_00495 [Pedobacter ginsenosidimutans]|uniref:Anti-sigma factor n=1 Tax=Pedobacter ginsenosidimutans TaxID=687842 RepID=A0A0T5VW70_9SPHI|nr:FecR family protein [Pedobacter ginsenosidimutans]KRT17812.1 hypothetical protein ASU31_00495 [Pedobacter ginsenosidimutans]